MQAPLLRLQCGVNSYEWGKKGSESCAGRYAAATASAGFHIRPDQPYAELWMGTHPSNPSYEVSSGQTLLQLIQENDSLLSRSIIAQYGSQLPFLFKILSIKEALSIQAHPNKKLAQQLHAKDPINYPDKNHKPEMAIAITRFEALCGFRPLEEIAYFLQHVPSLHELIGEDEVAALLKVATGCREDMAARKKALQRSFRKLMNASEASIESASAELVKAARHQSDQFAEGGIESTTGKVLSELVLRLYKQYGADHGLFVLFFANYVVLEPGEALYLQADDIHAYISGDIVECMATSDNVVRAGFTTKFKDVPTLVNMLTYNSSPIRHQKLEPLEYHGVKFNQKANSSGSFVKIYDPPIEEFTVLRSVLKDEGSRMAFAPLNGPSILICTHGRGTISVNSNSMDLEEGYVFFIAPGVESILEANGNSEDFQVYRAYCEVMEEKDVCEP